MSSHLDRSCANKPGSICWLERPKLFPFVFWPDKSTAVLFSTENMLSVVALLQTGGRRLLQDMGSSGYGASSYGYGEASYGYGSASYGYGWASYGYGN